MQVVLVLVLDRIGRARLQTYKGAGFIRARQSASLIGLAAWPSPGWREANRLGVKLFQVEALGIFTTSLANKLQTKSRTRTRTSTRTTAGRVRNGWRPHSRSANAPNCSHKETNSSCPFSPWTNRFGIPDNPTW